MKVLVCYWLWNHLEDYWQTSCGEAFNLTTLPPKDIGFKHCPYCGMEIEDDTQWHAPSPGPRGDEG
jgi:hypothetical protein